jgi:hypothetical protein
MVKTGGVLLLLLTAVGAVSSAYSAVTTQWVVGSTVTTVAGLVLDSKGSNAYVGPSTAISNTTSGQVTGAGYTRCAFEAFITFVTTPPTAGSALLVWLLPSVDGANYADMPSSTITTTPASFAMPFSTGTGSLTTRQVVYTQCPPGSFKVGVQLNGTGQTTSASGNTLKIMQYTPQGNP